MFRKVTRRVGFDFRLDLAPYLTPAAGNADGGATNSGPGGAPADAAAAAASGPQPGGDPSAGIGVVDSAAGSSRDLPQPSGSSGQQRSARTDARYQLVGVVEHSGTMR